MKLAVVLFNLGGPDSLRAVRPFLFNLFRDPAILDLPGPARLALAALISTTRARSARGNYALMGGRSPLRAETDAQAFALEADLRARAPQAQVRVFVSMRYWSPRAEETAAKVAAFAPDEVVLLPLYPQYSTTTTASSVADWKRAYKGAGTVRSVCCFPNAHGLVAAHAAEIERVWSAAGRPQAVRLLFSAHGLPQRVVDAGDPYEAQVQATAAAVAARLPDLADWQVCYQSRVGGLKWLGPYTEDAIRKAAADGKGVIVSPIAFVSEHVETLVELDRDYAHLARELGITRYLRAAAPGVHDDFVAELAKAALGALERPVTAPHGPWRCPAGHGKCPRSVKEETTAA